MKNNILEVHSLTKDFKMKNNTLFKPKKFLRAVDDVSFKIERGKILGLVGESGCGKSTTGRVILNLLKPTKGKVVFEDKIIFDTKENIFINNNEMNRLRKDMQIIFQDPYASLDPRMNIENIVSEGILKHKVYNRKDSKEKAKEILNLCGIDSSYMNRYPHEFSGGQRQRIGISRALALNPKFIVCDEITAALDVSVQSQILNLMLDLKDKFNLTYLFISHNLSVVKNFCDYINVMYLGSIVEQGTSEEVFNNPSHPYTKLLIKSIPSFKNNVLNSLEVKELESSYYDLKGCKFFNRCPYALEKCKNQKPKLSILNNNHSVSCFLYEK